MLYYLTLLMDLHQLIGRKLSIQLVLMKESQLQIQAPPGKLWLIWRIS